MKINRLLIFFFVLFFNCTKSIDNEKEFIGWFNNPENGFVKEKEINGLVYKVQYRPAELQAVVEAMKEGREKKLDSLVNEYKGSTDFLIEIKVNKAKPELTNMFASPEIKDAYRRTLIEGMTLSDQTNNFSPAIYHFENTYEIGNKFICLVSFPKTNSDTFTFKMKDEVINSGILKFNFDNKNKIPEYSF